MAEIGFMNVRVGDVVMRLVAEHAQMPLIVARVDERLIWATREEWLAVSPDDSPGHFWTFDRATGVEEDDDLGWGVVPGQTGSRLIAFQRGDRHHTTHGEPT